MKIQGHDEQIESLKDYKYGFSTEVETDSLEKGLNEEVIKTISQKKKSPIGC